MLVNCVPNLQWNCSCDTFLLLRRQWEGWATFYFVLLNKNSVKKKKWHWYIVNTLCGYFWVPHQNQTGLSSVWKMSFSTCPLKRPLVKTSSSRKATRFLSKRVKKHVKSLPLTPVNTTRWRARQTEGGDSGDCGQVHRQVSAQLGHAAAFTKLPGVVLNIPNERELTIIREDETTLAFKDDFSLFSSSLVWV